MVSTAVPRIHSATFVDINDLALLAANWQTDLTTFGQAAISLPAKSESFQATVATITFGGTTPAPEPTTLALTSAPS